MENTEKDLQVEESATFSYKTIWEDAKKLIASEVTVLTYDVWIKTLEPVGIRGDALILKANSSGAKNVINKNHAEKITRAITSCTSMLNSFEIVTDKDLEKENLQFAETEEDKKSSTSTENANGISENLSYAFNPKFTFDNYVIGPSNEFTVAAAKAVAENPGTNYNPLFIYGGAGLGKTHILHAIGNFLTENKPELNVVYITTEQFVNEFIETVRKNELDMNTGFRKKYRSVDVLIIDDIQSIIGKPMVQEEFFHTFNALTSQNKQIIISSDRPPKEISTLEDRLRSRFEWGLMTDIGIPEIETRIAILKKKVWAERYLVEDDVLEYIAEAMTTSVRELEGYLSICVFYAGLFKKPKVTLDVAKEALKNYITTSKKTFDQDNIIEEVCKYFSISKNQLLSKSQKKDLSQARQICIYLLNVLLGLPYTEIGKIFNKDHSTIIYCKSKVEKLLKTNKMTETQIKDLKTLITSKGF